MSLDFYKHEGFSLAELDRVIYIWARYEGTRDSSNEGKHYSKAEVRELIRRLNKFIDNPNSFNEGFERDEEDSISTLSAPKKLKIEAAAILNENKPELFSKLLEKGVDAVEPEMRKQLSTKRVITNNQESINKENNTYENVNMDSICKNCNKPKSQHIPCTTNDKIFWCYPNRNDKGYDEKKHLKKWAYQFESKDLENTKNGIDNSQKTKLDTGLSSKKTDLSSDIHQQNKELLDEDYSLDKQSELGGNDVRSK